MSYELRARRHALVLGGHEAKVHARVPGQAAADVPGENSQTQPGKNERERRARPSESVCVYSGSLYSRLGCRVLVFWFEIISTSLLI